MLKSKQIGRNFISLNVGKEYNGEPYYWTTFYYYKGLLLDTGCPNTVGESLGFLRNAKLNIEAILLTHYHEDHSGGAYFFKEEFGVDVFAPSKSLEILSNPSGIPVYRQIVWGQPKPVEAKALEEEMHFNQVTLDVIDTPGHSFDQVSFLVDNILFTGDLIANPKPVIAKRDEDYIDLIESLKTVVELDFHKGYGGHGAWNKSTIKETLSNILELKKKVDILHNKGLSAEQIVEEIFSGVSKKVLFIEEMSEYEWSRKNLVESLLGMRHKPS